LALTRIDVAKLLNDIAVAPHGCLHQVSAALVGDASGLFYKQTSHRLFVASQQQGL
jgi:hypothetical protein